MKNFQLVRASSQESAIATIAKDPGSGFVAGGTNLIDLMKKYVVQPDKLIDITGLDLKNIERVNGGVRIGALAKNAEVAENNLIMKKHPLLSMALAAGASQQIRNMATVGGNILQRTRCPYFYNTDMPCNKRQPKSGCGAREGFNRMHAIFGTSEQCIAVHPSDMCIALSALDAVVHVEGPKGQRQIPFEDFHRLPGDKPEKDTMLGPNELIVAVELPETGFTKNVHYLKVRDRSSYAFALVSVAAALDLDGATIKEVRLALGGVAHKPWRLKTAEEFLKGKVATAANFGEAARLAMQGARGYGDNDFKLTLTPNAIVEALTIAASK